MKVLLDTQVFLWWNLDDPRLSAKVRRIMADSTNTLVLSVVSAWEIAVKVQLGKLRVPGEPAAYVRSRIVHHRLEILPIQLEHAVMLATLPLHHRDPFDRMLIVQSQVEQLAILTSDSAFRDYAVDVIW